MRYYQLDGNNGQLAVRTDDGVFDLTKAKTNLRSFGDLLHVASIAGQPADQVTARLLEDAPRVADETPEAAALRLPVEAEEVWAAGVTYSISEEARRDESSLPDVYLDVYENARPEVFFKATPSRTVGPGEAVGVRSDSTWDVPEPELGVVFHRGEVVGFTVGNDMSSRSIEGANPLYLPQAKVYDRCCALGPCVRSAASLEDPQSLEMWMTISRGGDVMYDESTSTDAMVRTIEELSEYFLKYNAVPEVAVLLTGTSLVPDEEFTLEQGDIVDIGIEGIGTLTNPVTRV